MKPMTLLPLILLMVSCGQAHDSHLEIFRAKKPSDRIKKYDKNVWMLELEGKMRCTVTAIHKKFAVSAAHCLQNGSPASDYQLRSSNNEIKKISKIHSQAYSQGVVLEDAFPNFDIMLLELKDEFGFEAFPSLGKEGSFNQEPSFIAGYGRSEVDTRDLRFGKVAFSTIADDLKSANLRVIPKDSRPCDGDSGGPLFLEQNDEVYLMGVTHGLNPFINPLDFPDSQCSFRETTYTSISFHRPWIDSIVNRANMNQDSHDESTLTGYCKNSLKSPIRFSVLKTLGDQLKTYNCSDLDRALDNAKNLDFSYLNEPNLSFLKYGGKIGHLKVSFATFPVTMLSKDLSIEHLSADHIGADFGTFLDNTKDLQYLEVRERKPSNEVIDISGLAQHPSMKSLTLKNLGLQDVSVIGKLSILEDLDLSLNQINDSSFLDFTPKLTYLNLTGNRLKDVTPVAGLNELQVGIFNRNQIEVSANLSGLHGAQVLSFVEALRGDASIACPLNPDFDICIF